MYASNETSMRSVFSQIVSFYNQSNHFIYIYYSGFINDSQPPNYLLRTLIPFLLLPAKCLYSNYLDHIDKLNHSNGELLTLNCSSLQAKQYVGLIQFRDLPIAILPKMYRNGLTKSV